MNPSTPKNNYQVHHSLIEQNVFLGAGYDIDPFCYLGKLPKNYNKPGELMIGENTTIRSHTVIYGGNKIGDRFQTGHHVLVRQENQIGNDVSIGTSSTIEFCVTIGNNVRIHSQAFVPEYTVIEDDAWIGPNVVLTNAPYPKSPQAKSQLKGVIIKRGAIIGANATILPGIIIGEKALVGAGAVVTKNVAPGEVVVGNPHKILKNIAQLPY